VRARSGKPAAKAVGRYQGAVTELAFLRHKMARGSVGPQGREWHDELLHDVFEARAAAVGQPEALHAAWAGGSPPGWAPPPVDWRPPAPQQPPGSGPPPRGYPPPPRGQRAPGPWLPSQLPGPPPVPPQRRPPPSY
jgi:hypothetical protein